MAWPATPQWPLVWWHEPDHRQGVCDPIPVAWPARVVASSERQEVGSGHKEHVCGGSFALEPHLHQGADVSEGTATGEDDEDDSRTCKEDQAKGHETGDQVDVDAHGSPAEVRWVPSYGVLRLRWSAAAACYAPSWRRGNLPSSPLDPLPSMSRGERWTCIQGCGACCHLDPGEREEALQVLDEAQQVLYRSMVAEDGWCRHYDHGQRSCSIYDVRPDFCRVSNLGRLFGVIGNVDGFAIDCCRQQIRSEYGVRSTEMRRFNRAVRQP